MKTDAKPSEPSDSELYRTTRENLAPLDPDAILVHASYLLRELSCIVEDGAGIVAHGARADVAQRIRDGWDDVVAYVRGIEVARGLDR